MPKSTPNRLTPLEAVIMDSVWRMSEATVWQVRDDLEPVKPMAYNTVLTMMRILREKGFLTSKRQGRRDVYWPLVSRAEMGERSLRELLDRFFAGSAEALISQLLESEDLSAEQIRAIRREVDSKLRSHAKARTAGQ